MKERQVSGSNIYESIRLLNNDVEELGEALEAVRDALGRNTSAWDILRAQLEKVKQERDELLQTKYTVVKDDPLPFK